MNRHPEYAAWDARSAAVAPEGSARSSPPSKPTRPVGPRTLRGLLIWSSHAYKQETPSLEHAVALTDEGGAPQMKPAAASYLGLLARQQLVPDERPDDWKRAAGRRDRDGKYVTPLRYAIELCPIAEERRFLRSLVPELYFPSEIAEIHGIPKWAAGMVMYASLSRLRERYDWLMREQEKGTAAGWVSMSESSRNAIIAGEKGEAA